MLSPIVLCISSNLTDQETCLNDYIAALLPSRNICLSLALGGRGIPGPLRGGADKSKMTIAIAGPFVSDKVWGEDCLVRGAAARSVPMPSYKMIASICNGLCVLNMIFAERRCMLDKCSFTEN